jgi:hypothetical protein
MGGSEPTSDTEGQSQAQGEYSETHEEEIIHTEEREGVRE